MDLDFVSVHKHAKKELGQYPAILIKQTWSLTHTYSHDICIVTGMLTTTTTTNKFISLNLPSFFLHLLEYKNKIGEYWLPRITDNLIMMGSQLIHMYTTSLGRHTQ